MNVLTPPSVGKSKQSARYDVVLSYQSKHENLMLRVREALTARNITNFDGKQVPVGGDWRSHYFHALRKKVKPNPNPNPNSSFTLVI